MWQIFCIGSLLCGTLDETIDKAVMVGNKSIGLLNATWIRNIIFLLITILGSVVINKELPSFIFSVPIIILGILYAVNSIFYTLVLKHVEISAYSIISNLLPLIFLPIDIAIIGKSFLFRQILGIVLLVMGGIIFFYRGRVSSHSFSKKQIWIIILIFIFDALLFGSESYLFKNLFNKIQLSESSFLVNVWSVTLMFLSAIVIIRNFFHREPRSSVRSVIKYTQGSILSKIADFGDSFLFLKALTLSTTAQVSAMQSFYPIILVLVVLMTQNKFRVDLEEILDRQTLKNKIIGVVLICIGTILIR